MKKTLLVLALSLFIFGCASVEEMAERRMEEEGKITDVFEANSGPLHIIGFFSMSSEDSSHILSLTEKMKEKFKDNVEMEYRRSWEKRESLMADEASECARDQGKIKEFLAVYFNDYFEDFDRETMLEMALQTELDIEAFEACLDSETMRERVFRDKAFSKKYHVKEVPSFVIERSITISESLDEESFEKTIKELLKTLR
jgi:predicted DsbA family dithiol-disulfide isomerase